MTQEFYHEFKGFGRVISQIKVKIFSDDGEHFILFEDINDGTSVTNASEQLATEIVQKLKLDHDECRFFETYSQYNYEDIDEIDYSWRFEDKPFGISRWVAEFPHWKPSEPEIREMFNL
jgi:hypothetical protein